MKFDVGTIGKDSGGVGQTLSRLALLAGMLLGLPVAAGIAYATIYGIRQTVWFRHTLLVVLSVVSIVCGVLDCNIWAERFPR